ncbi:putative branched-subunit amino acid permease [Marmoricola sp. OAE513]|uniref:AzlC family ABC transporter permease n=1 Tax=Marmoricola sp. OAE513 TaxID=2817894 RepID=UPI001AEB0FF3
MTTQTEIHVPTTDLRRAAVRDIVAVAPGIVPFGIMLGVASSTLGTGALATLLGSVAVYGGSAQLTTMTALHLGAGLVTAVISGAVVNARIMLYGAALQPLFRDQPRWFRLIGPTFILDQTYLSAVGREDLSAEEFRRYWAWLGWTLLGVWSASVAAGVLVGPALPTLPHLATLVPMAMFLAMLVPRLVNVPAISAAATAALVAVAVAHLVPEVGILGGTLAGVATAVLVEERASR